MKRHPALFVLTVLSLAAAPAALAHPGHDGHELTWDFSHLTAHPLATLSCFLAISALAWIGWRYLRPTNAPQKSAVKATRQAH